MHRYVIYITVVIASISYTDGASSCPKPAYHLECHSSFLSNLMSSCQTDDQCPKGLSCCTTFWCVKKCISVNIIIAPLPQIRTREGGCTSQKDCKNSYCCVNLQPGATSGVCQKMGSSMEVCYTRDPYTAIAPSGIVQTCPCGFGNYCSTSKGKTHPQFGQQGTCNSF